MIGTWSGELAFSIFNPSGQLIHSEIFLPEIGSFAHPFDLGNIPAGVYWLQVNSGKKSWIQKMVVGR
ncbi:MAG: T9SS type A sorting domain-containing protein [Phycisphaerae bacterium]|nr:T9SS type A sorting domain-containing protein [Saprospiraceae bacterium]